MQIKNRGAVSNITGRFEATEYEAFDDGWGAFQEEALAALDTTLIEEEAKSIVSTNQSPDISFEQSINPYRGCEHGCIYCYARPSHAYWNLSPGLDFETKIFYKVNAAELLKKTLAKPNYVCKPIVIGANTDPYQPAESKLKITRSLLEVCLRCHQPIAIITKGALIERDLAILAQMAEKQLAKVAISITTLSIKLKNILEPRTAIPAAKLRIIKKCRELGIPVTVMAAPMIPMINDHELEHILKAASEAGAQSAGYTFIRLPHEVKTLFKEWLRQHFPDRAEHVMSIIKQMRGGKEYDAAFGKRMKGEGEFAKLLAARFKLACKRYQLNTQPSAMLATHLFDPSVFSSQLSLF